MRLASGTAVAVASVVAVAAAAAAAAPAAALREYNSSTRLDEAAILSWTLTPTAVRFGLVVTDEGLYGANTTTAATAAWVGLGVGEPTSGSMVGADIVTAEFSGPTACTLVNRHVPSVAVPLGSSTGGDGIYPHPDAPCAAESWSLVSCAVDAAAGTVTLEVDRPLAPADAAQDRPIVVAAEAVIDFASDAGRLVHHFILFSCDRDGDWASFEGGKSCLAELPQCEGIIYGWAVGATPLVMPPNAGFPVTEEERHYILQVHYDNPDGLTGVVDRNTSVRLHYTDQPRPQDAGIINIGDPNTVYAGQPVSSDRNYTIACPSECTSQLAFPLTIYGSVLHAHRTALYLFTNQYRNGTFLRTLEGAAFWSNDHQRPTLFEPADLLPGDRLEVTGKYDTSKIDAAGNEPPVTWGQGTPQEMLISFLLVVPRPLRVGATNRTDTISFCGLMLLDEAGTPGTMCSNGKTFTPGVS
eukprot:contig_22877_g5650